MEPMMSPTRSTARRHAPTEMRAHTARATIEDVARRAGVSRAAVSFAVNGQPGVADATRERIMRAADELHWRPSAPARALTHARAGAVGLVLERRSDQLELDDFFVRFLAGVERVLSARDCALLLQVVPPDARDRLDPYRRVIATGRVDGMLLTDVVLDDPRLELLAESGLPTVVAGRTFGSCPLPTVETQHA